MQDNLGDMTTDFKQKAVFLQFIWSLEFTAIEIHMYDVYKHVDAMGNCWQTEIIPGQLIKRTDPQGGEWQYS